MRVDSGIEEGGEVVGLYDPMIAKLLVWDSDRERARLRMLRALDEFVVEGVPDARAAAPADLRAPGLHRRRDLRRARRGRARRRARAGRARRAGLPPAEQRRYAVEVDGARYEVAVALPADELLAAERRRRAERARAAQGRGPGGELVASPMQGTVLRVEVGEGEPSRRARCS